MADSATFAGPRRDTLSVGDAALRRARAVVRAGLRWMLRCAISTPAGLGGVNVVHRRLSPAGKRRFYYLGADGTWRVEGRWSVDFAGRRLVLPLHRDFDFAWIAAIAFHGHDTEVCQLYERLMRGPRPPSVFFDVGASWGLHSLMLLAHGARVLSFEPNPACHRFFLDCCAANCLRPELHAVAVSDRSGVDRTEAFADLRTEYRLPREAFHRSKSLSTSMRMAS